MKMSKAGLTDSRQDLVDLVKRKNELAVNITYIYENIQIKDLNKYSCSVWFSLVFIIINIISLC